MEERFMTNRELARETHNMVKELVKSVAVMESIQDGEMKRTNKNENDIDNLKTWRNISGGWNGILTALAVALGLK